MQASTSSSKTLNNQNRAEKLKKNSGEGRNSRIMANIQATLNARTPNNLQTQTIKKKMESTIKFSLNSINEAMERISLADSDTSISLADVSKLYFY